MKALSFEGSGSEYFKIWIVNVLLTILTMGLYYPWAKVRNRRYFHANAVLEGKNFEYHATGKQLFLGFLLAMVLFILFVIASKVSPGIEVILALVLFFAIPWIIWRSLKFNMKMTSFSNVRFAFAGTAKDAYINFFVYPIVMFLPMIILFIVIGVLGDMVSVAYPIIVTLLFLATMIFAIYISGLLKKKNAEYIINGSRFGQGVFKTELEVKKFLLIMFKTVGMAFLIIGLPVIGISMLLRDMTTMNTLLIMILPFAYFFFIIASMVLIAYSVTRQRTYIFENTTLDNDIKFESTLKAKEFAWILVSNLFLILFTMGLAFPWAKVRVARVMLENTLVDTSVGFDAYMSQKQKEESSLGEQIGDAFDVDVGLGF